jgi:hypothetical protein
MLNRDASKISSVTSRLGVDAFDQVRASMVTMHASVYAHLFSKKRADASMSNEKVRELLFAAQMGGMTQKEFELAAGRLRPNTSTRSQVGFNGRLWHHYTATDASMSCSTFIENCIEFSGKGWLSLDQCRPMVLDALATQIVASCGRPATPNELAVKVSELYLESTVKRLAPDMPPRVLGATMRKLRSLPADERADFAREAVHQLLMAETYGKGLTRSNPPIVI